MVDRIASLLGILGAPQPLLQSAQIVLNHIDSYLHYYQRCLRLRILTKHLMDTIGSASPAAFDHAHHELQSVLETLMSIQQRPSMLSASGDLTVIKQAEQKADNFINQFEVVRGMLPLVSTVCNENIELPSSEVSLDRARTVLDFLQTSQEQDFRVIAIHGQPGVGKTTLLNNVWDKVSGKWPFHYAQAYVQIGHDATPSTILQSQSNILRQLGGDNKEFPSAGFGRGELKKHIQQLKTQRKPLLLAIDNVFKVEDLECLLPGKLDSENLPTLSSIVITCRDYRIVKALVTQICSLQLSDEDRVLCYEPQYLDLEESRRLFAECAGIQASASEHQELLDALVLLCGGLSLALTVLGNVFKDESMR